PEKNARHEELGTGLNCTAGPFMAGGSDGSPLHTYSPKKLRSHESSGGEATPAGVGTLRNTGSQMQGQSGSPRNVSRWLMSCGTFHVAVTQYLYKPTKPASLLTETVTVPETHCATAGEATRNRARPE